MHDDTKAGSRKVVLVVDDEPLVRLNAVDMFEDMGFEVLEAADGASALRVLEARRDIALLFSDCRMPGISGPELARMVTDQYPQVRIVLVSGYVNVQKLDWPLLPKPYDASSLRKVAGDIAPVG